MKISDIVKDQVKFDVLLQNKVSELATLKERNENIDRLKMKLAEVQDLSRQLTEYHNNLVLIQTACTKAEHNYQTRRIAYLNDLITKSLQNIFPKENFTVNIIYDRKIKDTIRLELIDGMGNRSTPCIGQGQLMQYVISFVAVAGITKGLGFKNLFVDEAFGVAAATKLPDLGDVINSYVKDGMQIILVSQNDSLYKGIPHRVIQLEKNGVTGTSRVTATLDY